MGTYAHARTHEIIPGHSFKRKEKLKGSWGPFSTFKSNQFDGGPLRAKFAEEKKQFESEVCPPFLPLVGELISDLFQVMSEEAKRKTERDDLKNAHIEVSLLKERAENAERENARLRAQLNVKG
jgi:hypothetical protein